MALKVWDGFDHYSATADFKQRSGFLQWQLPAVNAPVLSFVTGRNLFGKALQVSGGQFSGFWAVFGDRNAEAIVGFAMLFGSTVAAAGCRFQFWDTVADQIQATVWFNEDNYAVQVYRGDTSGTLLYASPNNVWAGHVWNFVEIRVKIHDSAGEVQARVNGVTVATITGVDTKATSNTWWDKLLLRPSPDGISNAPIIQLDDLYYCDTTMGAGTFPANTFLGDAKVVTLFATGNDSVQWTPLSGTNYQMIDEQAMDGDATYNYETTAGDQDTFVFEPLESVITVIYGVQVTYAARKDDAGMRVTKSVAKVGGTSYFGADKSLPDQVYTYFTDLWILNPNTAANWTITGVNAATYGYRLVS